MILQALVAEYEALAARGVLDRPGWNNAKISFAIELDEEGNFVELSPRKTRVEQPGKSGKVKELWVPQFLAMPSPVKRANSILANFLWDNSAYLLGIDNKGKPERTRQCFEAAAKLHHRLLDGLDSEMAKAICHFFDSWNPETALTLPEISQNLDELYKGGNLLFSIDGEDAQEDEEIRHAWQSHYDHVEPDAAVGQCLVTGREEPIAILHPNLKGVRDAQSSGAALVSFNVPSSESFGNAGAQGRNAPVGQYAAFAYTTALNSLLSDRARTQFFGDTTVVCWAKCGEPAYQDIATVSFSDEEIVRAVLAKLAAGQSVDWKGVPVSPEEPFYILGLAPNAARVSVRFFYRNTFGKLAENMQAHFDRLELYQAGGDGGRFSVWGLLQETVNQKASKPAPKPQLAGDLVRAILTGDRYPESLLNAVEIRIRAEHELSHRRAAILKAYLMKNCQGKPGIEEVTTVKVNEQTHYAPYVLGRIFAQYEKIQQWANPGINTTIRDRYFNSAAATPASVFALLGKLCQNHLRKLDGGMKVSCEKTLTALYGLLDETLPQRLTLQEQAAFQLGYYHETQKIYTKKN